MPRWEGVQPSHTGGGPSSADGGVAGTGSMAVPVAGWWRRVRAAREVPPLLWEMDPVLGDVSSLMVES